MPIESAQIQKELRYLTSSATNALQQAVDPNSFQVGLDWIGLDGR